MQAAGAGDDDHCRTDHRQSSHRAARDGHQHGPEQAGQGGGEGRDRHGDGGCGGVVRGAEQLGVAEGHPDWRDPGQHRSDQHPGSDPHAPAAASEHPDHRAARGAKDRHHPRGQETPREQRGYALPRTDQQHPVVQTPGPGAIAGEGRAPLEAGCDGTRRRQRVVDQHEHHGRDDQHRADDASGAAGPRCGPLSRRQIAGHGGKHSRRPVRKRGVGRDDPDPWHEPAWAAEALASRSRCRSRLPSAAPMRPADGSPVDWSLLINTWRSCCRANWST